MFAVPLRAGHSLALAAGLVAAIVVAELVLRRRYRRRVLPQPTTEPGEVVIVALGDSITAGTPGGQAAAWPSQLERRLRASYPGVPWRVINAGVPGDTAPLGYRRFEVDVARMGPQAVLISFGLNDCNPDRYGLDRWLEARTPGGLARSYLWRAALGRGERLGRRLGWLTGPRVEATRQPYARTSAQGFSTALAALTARSRDIGARPVLLTMTPLAEAETPGVRARKAVYTDYNARIRRLAAHEQHPLVELAAGAPADAFDPDGFHLTAAGQAWVTDQVFDQLATNGFWEQLIRARRNR